MKNRIFGIIILVIIVLSIALDFFIPNNLNFMLPMMEKLFLLFAVIPGLILIFSKKENKIIGYGSYFVLLSVILLIPFIGNILFMMFGFLQYIIILLGLVGAILTIVGLFIK